MSETLYLSGWRLRALVLSVVLSALSYLALSLWGGWRDVADAVAAVGVLGIAITLSMSLLNYGLRFVRWQMYLRALGHYLPVGANLKIYLAGFALTTTPGKTGEALRSVFLKRWAVPYPQSFAAFFSERLSDLLAIVLLTFFGLTLYPPARPLMLAGAALVLMAFFVLSRREVLKRLHKCCARGETKIGRFLVHLFQVLLEAHRCHRLSVLLAATGLSILAWSAEALAFYWVLNWMGADVTLVFAVFVYAIAVLAGALSFMPGGLGGTEAVMFALLVWKGMAPADAVAATLVIRLATLWFAVAIGACILLRGGWEHNTASGEG